MAHAEMLPPAILSQIREQVNERLGHIDQRFQENAGVLAGNVFSVWLLADPGTTDETLDDLAVRVARWHHQIRTSDGETVAFARSAPPEAEWTREWTVPELFISEIPARLEEAYRWLDAAVPGDPLVRLLVAPAFHLHAFWLTSGHESQVVLADAPAGVVELQYREVYGEGEFLDALRQGHRIQGVVPNAEVR